MNLRLRSSPSGRELILDNALLDWGTQASWAIDPVVGNDTTTQIQQGGYAQMGQTA